MSRRSINGHSRRRSNKRKSAIKMVGSPSAPESARMTTPGSMLTEISSPMKKKAIERLELDRAFNRKRRAKWYNAGSMHDSQGYEAQDQELSSLASTGQYIPPDSAI